MLQKKAEIDPKTKEQLLNILKLGVPTFALANLANYAVGGRKPWTWLTANGAAAAATAVLSSLDYAQAKEDEQKQNLEKMTW